MANEEVTTMTKTKEKILFETNELVISLNTQVATLTLSNNMLKDTIESYMSKMDRHMEKMDERDATLDQRMTMVRNDLTKEQGRIDNVISDVAELKADQSVVKWLNFAITSIVSAISAGIAYYLGQR
jgi:CII-binding regulator of phage lambda lysogenization HflD